MTDLLIIDNGTGIAFRSQLDHESSYGTVARFAGYSNGVRKYVVEWDQPASPAERTSVLAENEFDIVPVTPPSLHHIAGLSNADFEQHMRDGLL